MRKYEFIFLHTIITIISILLIFVSIKCSIIKRHNEFLSDSIMSLNVEICKLQVKSYEDLYKALAVIDSLKRIKPLYVKVRFDTTNIDTVAKELMKRLK